MRDLRAPDPTLHALGDDLVDVAIVAVVPVAHHITGDCGFVRLASLEGQHAAYFAVPCRECFPDAPPPGHGDCTGAKRCDFPPDHYCRRDPYLKWQVQP